MFFKTGNGSIGRLYAWLLLKRISLAYYNNNFRYENSLKIEL